MFINKEFFTTERVQETLQKIFVFMLLLSLVLLVNYSVLSYDMMFFEQPILYLVNQTIHSWQDLLAVYLHPKVLDTNYVPFFRPSGHFLVYQLVTPWLGWHNTRGLLIVNFIFLTLMGWMMIKIYQLLFPDYKAGGYIAFAICVMHPVFLLSRFTPMHFEYASIFFLLSSLYCFMIFLQKNTDQPTDKLRQPLTHFFWLCMTLLFYFIATTFKETTLMLAPALVCYLAINQNFRFDKEKVQLILMVAVVAVTIGAYFSLAWLNEGRPLIAPISLGSLADGINYFLKTLFSFPYNFTPRNSAPADFGLWNSVVVPPVDSMLLLTSMFLLPVTVISLWRSPTSPALSQQKKATVFLYLCVAIFLVLPILWAHQMPWHAGVSLVFLSLLIGFTFESLFARISPALLTQKTLGYGLALLISLATIPTNQVKINFLEKTPTAHYMRIDRNAVFSPPVLADKFNNESTLIVENSMIRNSDYMLGDSVYPYVFLGDADIHRFRKNVAAYRYPYVYGGTLFRWAYLRVALKEQVYPFRVNQMDRIVDDEVIYNWLAHYDNIFCVGFDNNGHWSDKTASFKQNLLIEKARRHMVINTYKSLDSVALSGTHVEAFTFKAPDSMVCKQLCDNSKNCSGFTYYSAEKNNETVTVCKFYQSIASKKIRCQNCTGFVKELA